MTVSAEDCIKGRSFEQLTAISDFGNLASLYCETFDLIMCALLAPIIKSGYNLFTPGVGTGQKSGKHQQLVLESGSSPSVSSGQHRSKQVARSSQEVKKVRPPSETQEKETVRHRTTSEQSPLAAAPSGSGPSVVNVGVRRKTSAGPPPVDIYRRRSALSTSQYYLQQRRILAQQQQAKRLEMAQKQFAQQQQEDEKSLSHGSRDENRSR